MKKSALKAQIKQYAEVLAELEAERLEVEHLEKGPELQYEALDIKSGPAIERGLRLTRQERIAQIEKWGDQRRNSPQQWLVILGEEFGEVARAILEREHDNYPVELVQVAAVALAALEAYDAGSGLPEPGSDW